MFDAFVLIYESRVSDLRRIATGGTGVLPAGDIHPDLARRFADEASKAAQHVLTICIRALDYLPPVDMTFGDYLRALITADMVIVPDDSKRYRLAFIEAFRNHGIYPLDVRSLGEDSLRWIPVNDEVWHQLCQVLPPREVLRTMANAWEVADGDTKKKESKAIGLKEMSLEFLEEYWTQQIHDSDDDDASAADWNPSRDNSKNLDTRKNVFLLTNRFRIFIWKWLVELTKRHERNNLRSELKTLSAILGIDFEAFSGYLNKGKTWRKETGAIEVHTVRPTFRVQDNGHTTVELLVVLTQWRWETLLDENGQEVKTPSGDPVRFRFRGGATLIIDPKRGRLKYAITKNIGHPDDVTNARLARVRRFLREQLSSMGEAAFDRYPMSTDVPSPADQTDAVRTGEPLALLHRDTSSGDW